MNSPVQFQNLDIIKQLEIKFELIRLVKFAVILNIWPSWWLGWWCAGLGGGAERDKLGPS